MHNRLYEHLTTEKRRYSKQFGFQTGLSTEHAIVRLVDQIYKSFERNQYTLGIFIDLSKAFDTIDQKNIKGNTQFVWKRTLDFEKKR